MKTRKTIAKRIKVTKTGKMLKRKAGQDHFNSRERSKVTRAKRRDIVFSEKYGKTLKGSI